MSEGTLPPVLATITADASEFIAAFGAADEALASFADDAEASTARAAGATTAVDEAVDTMANETVAAAARAATSTEAMAAAMDEAAAQSGLVWDEAAARYRTSTGQFASAADVAAADVTASGGKMGDAAEDAAVRTEQADKDVEDAHLALADVTNSATTRIGGLFTNLGNTMASWGIPFASSITKVGADLEAAETDATRYGAVLADLGGIATAVTAAGLVAVSVEAVKMASTFDAAMEQLHTQAQVPQADISDLSDKVLSLAGVVGENPDSLADALFHIESAFQSTGITGQKAMSLLQTAAEGAKVGGADLTDVTNALDASIASGIPGVQNFGQAMGALNAIVGSGDMHMQDLANALGSGVLAVVKNYGLSLTDVGAALATFGDNNIRGAKAATDLRMAVQAMAVPMVSAAGYLQSIGMSYTQMATDMQHGGLVPALEDLRQHLEAAGVTGNQVGEALTTIFGKKAGSGAAVLYDQLDRLKSKYTDIAAASTKFGGDWNATQETTKQELDQVGDSLKALAISYGNWLTPKLKEALQIVEQVVVWFDKHRTVTIALISVIGGALLTVIAAYTVSMISAAAATIAATWPILAVIAAAVLLAAGIYELVTHWHQVTKAVENFIVQHKALAVVIALIFAPITSAISLIVGIVELIEHWGEVTQWFSSTWNSIADSIEGAVAPVISWLEGAWGDVSAAVASAFDAVADAVGSVLTPVVTFIEDQIDGLVSWWQAHWTEIHDVLQVVWGLISTVVKVAVSNLTGVVKLGIGEFEAVWTPFWTGVETAMQLTWDVLTTLVKVGWDFLSGVITTGLDVLKTAWSLAWTAISTVLQVTWAAFKLIVSEALNTIETIIGVGLDLITGHWGQAWTDLKDGVTNTVMDVVNFLSSIVSIFVHAGSSIGSAIWNGITSVIGDLASMVGNLFNDALSGIEGFATDFFNGAVKLGEAIVNGIVSALKSIGSTIMHTVGSTIAALPGGSSIDNFLGLPHAASGGIVSQATLLVAGEAGPEAIVPLTGLAHNQSAIQPLPEVTAAAAAPGVGSTSLAGGGGGDLVIHMNGQEVARATGDDFYAWLLRKGRQVGSLWGRVA